MSDDFYAQQMAFNAASDASAARRDAIQASHDAAMARIDADRMRKVAEEAASDARMAQFRMVRDQEETNERLASSGLVREAVAAIPFLRGERQERFGQRPAMRSLADAWLQGVAWTPEQQALFDQALDGTAPQAATWLAYALAGTRARENGDADAAQRWHQVAAQASPRLARTWSFLDDLRRGEAPDADKFNALMRELERYLMLNQPMFEIVSMGADGLFGAACQASADALLAAWLPQQRKEPKALLDMLFAAPAATPEQADPTALDRIDPAWARHRYQQIIERWGALQGVDDALARPPKALSMPSAQTFAVVHLRTLAALPDDDELKTVGRLAYYQAAVDGRGDANAASRAENDERARQQGKWYQRAGLIAGWADHRPRAAVLQAMAPAILERSAALVKQNLDRPAVGQGTDHADWRSRQVGELERQRLETLKASGELRTLQRKAERAAAWRRRATIAKWTAGGALAGYLFTFNPFNPVSWFMHWVDPYHSYYPVLQNAGFFGVVGLWRARRMKRDKVAPRLAPIAPTPEQSRDWAQVDAAITYVEGMAADLPGIQARIRDRLGALRSV